MRKIATSLVTIFAVVVMVAGSTQAVFSDTDTVTGNTFSTGSVTLGDTWNMPLNFTNLIPGIQQTQDVAIQYEGTTPADIYVGVANQSGDAFYDPVLDKSYMEVAIWDRDTSSWIIGWTPIEHYLANWTKVATNINGGTWKNYTVYVRLYDWVDNTFENKTNTSKVIIHAVQTGYSAPIDAPWTY